MPEAPVLQVQDLAKTFHIGFFRKRVEAVRGVSFDVRPGEIFGLLGPNGAGKTTTIKSVLRLIFPSRGSVRLFGEPVGQDGLRRLGYLPENPYVYQYLRPLEFLDLCGRLCGMDPPSRRRRAAELLERVGLDDATDRPIGKFSKGMMQRVGLAQALLHDPEVLVLDEPMSGLDPIGRRMVRDLLIEQRRRGKTLLFTSHILSDVEMLCDRVAIVHRGQVTDQGPLHELLRPEVRRVELELEAVGADLREALHRAATDVREMEGRTVAVVEGDTHIPDLLAEALRTGARIVAVTPQRETLEDLFVRDAVGKG
jgi:ABC-2 type transport system ATP-binding protein